MNVKASVAMIILAISLHCFADDQIEISSEAVQQLLGSNVEEVRSRSDFTISEHPDWVDENEVTIHTQKWLLKYPNGVSLLLYSDNSIIGRIQVRTSNIRTDRGVAVGDTIAEVMNAYPDSRFEDGSRNTLSAFLHLYAENGNILFKFYDKGLSAALRSGEVFQLDNAQVRDLKVDSINFRNGDQFACDNQFPCPYVPSRYRRE